jgi:histidyl-tRNA synthetase
LLAHFEPHLATLSDDSQRRARRNPLRLLDSKAPEDQPYIEAAPRFDEMLCEECEEHFARVRALLDAAGLPYRVNPRIVRGLDYYTRTVFEFISGALGAQNSVCGGGRYDDLVRTLGGPPTPAVGFGLGLERFLMVVDASGRDAPAENEGIFAIALGEAARTHLFTLVAALRRAGQDVPVIMDYGHVKMEAHLKRAERAGARAALIVGDDELAQRRVGLRDLRRRAQTSLPEKLSAEETAHEVLAWYRDLALAECGERRAG